MRPAVECGLCTFRWIYERASLEGLKGEEGMLSLMVFLEGKFEENANVGLICSEAVKKAYEFLNFKSPYFELFKKESNKNAKTWLPQARMFIEKAKNEKEQIKRMLSIASAANVSPVEGPKRPYDFGEFLKLQEGKTEIRVDEEVVFSILESERIIYLADNAGEIGFDGLFIEKLKEMGKKVYLFVKIPPFFDDASKEDVEEFEIERFLNGLYEIEGFFWPLKLKGEAEEVFRKADLLLSKGVGNYETIGEEKLGKPVIHMFKVKCLPIAKKVKSQLGELKVLKEV